MYKNLSKFTTILTACLLTGSILSGCNSKAKAVVATSAKPVVIDYLAYNSDAQPDPNSEVIKQIEKKFNVTFNFWYIDSASWDDSLNLKLASGDMPDVFRIKNLPIIAKYQSQGVLAPIDMSLLKKYAPTYVKAIDTDYQFAWDQVKNGGQVYALPVTNLNGKYPTSVIWRQDWLDNVGINKLPSTIQEYEDALLKFRNNDPDKNGKKDTYGMSDFAIPNILGAYGDPAFLSLKAAVKGDTGQALPYYAEGGKVVFGATQPAMKQALATLQKWYKEGIIDPEFITGENTTGYWADSQSLYNGKIGLTGQGMFYHWRNLLNPDNPADKGGSQYVNFKKSQPNGTITFGKPAVGPDGKSGTPAWSSSNEAIGISTKAAKDPNKIVAIYKMIEATYSDYNFYKLANNGIEGTNYKVSKTSTGEDFIVNLHPEWKPSDTEKAGIMVGKVNMSPDNFAKQSDPFTFGFADKYAKNKAYNNVFVPVPDSFTKYAVNLAKIEMDSYVSIITGTSSVDSFDDFVKKFNSNGGDQVIKDLNDTYSKMTK